MRTKNLTDIERHNIGVFLLQNLKHGKPKRGSMKQAATQWLVSCKTIQDIWTNTKKQRAEGLELNLKSKKKGKKGKKCIEIDIEAIKKVALSERRTLRSFETTLKTQTPPFKVGRTTIAKWIKLQLLRRHSNAIKPELTTDCKFLRLNFTLGKLVVDELCQVIKFKGMTHIIHIDEKWFYLTRSAERYILLPCEDEPYRCVKNKKFITNVMFLCAVSRTIYDNNGELIFDGKIVMWPFTFQQAAQRASRNRPAGTLITKPIKSINKAVTKQFLIEKVIPAIKTKWPEGVSRDIIIQQDNAKPHINGQDRDFIAAATSDGFNISLSFKPPNSPDLNVLDLGFFRAIQSLQTNTTAYTIDQLVYQVGKAFTEMQAYKLSKVFLSLQASMVEIMKVKGHNNYKLPHMGKDALLRQGLLPDNLTVEKCLVRECIEYLREMGQVQPGLDGLITSLGLVD